MELVDDDALLPSEVAPPLGEGLELLDEGLDESLDEEGLDEVLGEAVLPEDELSLGVLLMPPLDGAAASDPAEVDPAEGLPLVLEPDAPEELSPVDPDAAAPAPAPCAHAAVAKATMAAVTAALMSFRFIFSSSRVGMEVDCAAPERKNDAVVRCAGEENSCARLSVWTFSARGVAFWRGSFLSLSNCPASRGGHTWR